MLSKSQLVLIVSTFKQYVGSPGNWAYCYAELTVSFLAVAVAIASTYYAYRRRDGQVDWREWQN